MNAAPLRSKHLMWALAAVALAFASSMTWLVIHRIQFPYDHYIWSESPFLTNMLKLHNGVELYGSPADANSFVYSPALEYIAYAVLSPFDLHLDVRACRAVNAAIGMGAAATATVSIHQRWLAALGESAPKHSRRTMVWIACVCFLLVSANFTFDICHPDNLHIFIVALGLALGNLALTRRSFRLALLTSAILGCGLLLKQTCALAGIGVGAHLALWARKKWGWQKAAWLIATPLATTGLCAWWLLAHDAHGKFWLLDNLLRQDKPLSKLQHLFAYEMGALHRWPLYIGAAWSVLVGLTSTDEDQRNVTGLWLTLGFFAVAPAIGAYVKVYGLANNLFVIDLWAAMGVLPHLLSLAHKEFDERQHSGFIAGGALCLITLGLFPVKARPLAEHFRHGEQLEAALRKDIAANRAVLVAHGTAAWIRAGLRTVPLDRSISVMELQAGGRERLAQTRQRLADRRYDRVYLGWPAYPAEMLKPLTEHYRVGSTIRAVKLPDDSVMRGWSPQMAAAIKVFHVTGEGPH